MSWNGPSSFDIPGDPSLVNDCPGAGSAIDFCHGVSYIVRVVFRAAVFGNSADAAEDA